jgi:tetratricopeptide (TPR) repeat protein
VDPATYDLYLQGRYLYLGAGTFDSLQNARAIEAFRRAIARDSTYAPAWAGLADVLGRLGETRPQRAAAERALALDSTLADAHAARAHVLAYDERRWPEALRSIDRALALSPGSVTILLQRAAMATTLGRVEQAVADVDRAYRLDPLSPAVIRRRADVYRVAGRLDDAIRIYKTLLAERPDQSDVHGGLALAYMAKGMGEEAAAEFLAERTRFGGQVWGDTVSAAIARDDRATMLRIAREGESKPHGGPFPPVGLAFVYAKLGDHDRAFAMLDRAYAELGTFRWLLLDVLQDPRLAPLRGDPRYRELVRRWVSPP